MKFSVVITSYWNDLALLPQSLYCVLNQDYKHYEIIVTVRTHPNTVIPQLTRDLLNQHEHRLRIIRLGPERNAWGNQERNIGMNAATGDYIVWLNCDNLAYPNWLSNHALNLMQNPNAVSIVNIHCWRFMHDLGVFPTKLDYGGVCELNYAMPLELAKKIDAFGVWCEKDGASDWFTLQRAMNLGTSLIWDRKQAICAAHL